MTNAKFLTLSILTQNNVRLEATFLEFDCDLMSIETSIHSS